MDLYHGSVYNVTTLKPAFHHTNQLVEWDGKYESNKFLYLTINKDDAFLFALSSYLEQHYKVNKVNITGKILKVYIEELTQQIKEEILLKINNLTLYVYKVKYSDKIKKVNNPINNYNDEYKTDEIITLDQIESVNAIEFKNSGCVIEVYKD